MQPEVYIDDVSTNFDELKNIVNIRISSRAIKEVRISSKITNRGLKTSSCSWNQFNKRISGSLDFKFERSSQRRDKLFEGYS